MSCKNRAQGLRQGLTQWPQIRGKDNLKKLASKFISVLSFGTKNWNVPESSLLLYGVLVNALLADETDVRHVPEVLVEVEGVADHELVGDLEGHVVRCVAVALGVTIKI